MSLSRARALLLALLLLAAAALLAIAWATRAPSGVPSPAPLPATASPDPAVGPPPSAPSAASLAGDCPPALAVEVLAEPRFSEPWAMCRLFGNHDAQRGTSRSPGAVARIALSTGFEDGPLQRHVLVIAHEATDDAGGVLQGRGAATHLAANVFERGAAGWRFVTSGDVGAADRRDRLPRLELRRVGRARHGLLVGGARPDLATIHAVSEMGVPALLEDVPLGGTNAGECAPPRCYEWQADLTFERGAHPDYDDAVIRVTGSRPDDDERVWPVNETSRWVMRGGRYQLEP